jgi:hypothetical protein
LIMLLTALPPAPPTPKMVIRGFNSLMSSFFELMLTACLFIAATESTAECVAGRWPAASTKLNLRRHPRLNRVRLTQQVAPAPHGLNVVLAIRRLGELLAHLAHKNVDDLDLRLVHAPVKLA